MRTYTLELPHSALLRWVEKDPTTGKVRGYPLVMQDKDGKRYSDHASIKAARALGIELTGIIAENELPEYERLKKSCVVCAMKNLPVVLNGHVLQYEDDGKDDGKVALRLTCHLLPKGELVL